MLIHIQNLVDDAKCYEVVRHLRWPEGVHGPTCGSAQISQRGHHTHQKERQRFERQACQRQFDDTCTGGKCRCLTETIFEGHHQSLKVWILCLYLMGPKMSNAQIAAELDLALGDVQHMTSQLREGVGLKKAGRLERNRRSR